MCGRTGKMDAKLGIGDRCFLTLVALPPAWTLFKSSLVLDRNLYLSQSIPSLPVESKQIHSPASRENITTLHSVFDFNRVKNASNGGTSLGSPVNCCSV